jgi:serine/threonine protein kinase
MDSDIKYIAEGTYGCVYNGQMACNIDTDLKHKDKYVSKIQFANGDTKETNIGKLLQNIYQYEFFFAPILDTCPIDIGIIEKDEIKKCDIITNDVKGHSYVSSRIRYVGNSSIEEYLEKIILEKNKTKAVFETHLYILKGLDLLLSLSDPIVHYDLKDNNIIFDSIYDIPIIIDFGLSFTKTEIIEGLKNPKTLKNIFYTSVSSYPSWSIEIILLSHIVQNIILNEIDIESNIIDDYIDGLIQVVETFVETSVIFTGKDEINEFKEKMIQYIISFKTKTIRLLINDLLKNWQSWDNYAIAVTYYSYLKEMNNPYIYDYKKVLKNIILTTSEGMRPLPNDTYKSIIGLTRKNL